MSDERGELESGASRRAWLAGAGAIGATAVLAACGTNNESPGTPPGADGNGSEPGPDDTGGGDTGGDQEPLTSADEVEVGGGVILASESVVVTQPTAGTFKGFSAACTHEGCTVSSIRDGIIHCACHGSQYSIEDGSVLQAAPGLTPQTQNPLPTVEILEDGGSIVRA
ncbi:MAG: Rieske 2Fe-2S domain-containing protein [Micromonosporaceae bacterium]|nr:Rieske 2Fe-2S domain-containing protein [Micromonosporaceae bacterium]